MLRLRFLCWCRRPKAHTFHPNVHPLNGALFNQHKLQQHNTASHPKKANTNTNTQRQNKTKQNKTKQKRQTNRRTMTSRSSSERRVSARSRGSFQSSARVASEHPFNGAFNPLIRTPAHTRDNIELQTRTDTSSRRYWITRKGGSCMCGWIVARRWPRLRCCCWWWAWCCTRWC